VAEIKAQERASLPRRCFAELVTFRTGCDLIRFQSGALACIVLSGLHRHPFLSGYNIQTWWMSLSLHRKIQKIYRPAAPSGPNGYICVLWRVVPRAYGASPAPCRIHQPKMFAHLFVRRRGVGIGRFDPGVSQR
jgi:hypothetical protein